MKPKRILIALAASVLSTSLAVAAGNITPSSAEASQNQQVISADRLSQTEIRQVQESLNAAGHMAGPVDGIWGPMTEDALRQFQEARGIEATGQLDQESVLALGLPISDFAAGEFQERTDDPR